MPDMKQKAVLDLGCGNRKRAGAIGIDINADTEADVVHDLNSFPYPFEESTFDEIYADNVVEHLDDVVKVMEEIHRIARPGASVTIIAPYFRSRWAYIDPTHKHFFTTDSFSFFDPEHVHSKLYNYSHARFRMDKMVFNENITRGGILDLYFGLVKAVANRFPFHYEMYLSNLFPLDTLTYYLRAVK